MGMTPSPSAAALTVSELGLNDPTGLSKLIFAVASSGGRFIPRQHRIQCFAQVADHSGFQPSLLQVDHTARRIEFAERRAPRYVLEFTYQILELPLDVAFRDLAVRITGTELVEAAFYPLRVSRV